MNVSTRNIYRSRIACVFLALFPQTAFLQDVTPHEAALLADLRTGGYNIYFRHAATDWSQSDRVRQHGDWHSCDAEHMRQLSDAGRHDARRIGAAMRELRIPVSRILASPYCRTVQTAELLQLGTVTATNAVINMRVADYFGGRAAITESAAALLARMPPPGGNTVIVAHGNVAIATLGFRPDEGEAVIVRPKPDGAYDIVGRITPAAFERLTQSVAH